MYLIHGGVPQGKTVDTVFDANYIPVLISTLVEVGVMIL